MIFISVVHGMWQAVDLIWGWFLLLRPRPETQSVLLWIKLPVMALMINIRLNQATFVWPGVGNTKAMMTEIGLITNLHIYYMLTIALWSLNMINAVNMPLKLLVTCPLAHCTGAPGPGCLKLEKVNYFEAHFSGLSSKVWESCCEMSRSTHTALAV